MLDQDTIEEVIGNSFSVRAATDGVVDKVTPTRVSIKTKDGVVEQPRYVIKYIGDRTNASAAGTARTSWPSAADAPWRCPAWRSSPAASATTATAASNCVRLKGPNSLPPFRITASP